MVAAPTTSPVNSCLFYKCTLDNDEGVTITWRHRTDCGRKTCPDHTGSSGPVPGSGKTTYPTNGTGPSGTSGTSGSSGSGSGSGPSGTSGTTSG